MTPDGTGHVRPLYITVKCKDMIVARVLIDNGSALNVCPRATLDKLPIDQTHMRKTCMAIRAFDGTRRESQGEIELPLEIGPCTFHVHFQVMDITPALNMLLGRPWIHLALQGLFPPSERNLRKPDNRTRRGCRKGLYS